MSEDVDRTPFAFIGRNIRTLRRGRGLTQEQLGKSLRRRKLSRQAIIWIESGKNTDLETIADIAATLAVNVEQLLRGETTGVLDPPVATDTTTLVNDLLNRPVEQWAAASRHRRYHSSAVVRTLLDNANSEYDKSAVRTRAMNEAAAEIARYADLDPVLRVEALKDLANTAARMGDHPYALRVLDEAAGVARNCEEAEYQSAIVGFARAVVYFYAERLPAIIPILRTIRPHFQNRDRRRFLLTQHLEAIVLAESGRPNDAVALIQGFVDEIAAWGDEDELSRLYTVLSSAWLRAGNRDLALQYSDKASDIHTRKGLQIEVATDDLRRGEIDGAFGKYEEALAALDRARRQFVNLCLPIHIVGVDLVRLRIKILQGTDPREIYDLCSQVAAEASAADLPVTASEAIDWLRRIVNRITPAAVDHVLAFVQDAEAHPDLRFEPPDA